MSFNPACRNCDIEMKRGFQLDYAHSTVLQTRWVPGDPSTPGLFNWGEAKGDQRDQALRVTSFRCPKCGLLDSYAIDPAEQPA